MNNESVSIGIISSESMKEVNFDFMSMKEVNFDFMSMKEVNLPGYCQKEQTPEVLPY